MAGPALRAYGPSRIREWGALVLGARRGETHGERRAAGIAQGALSGLVAQAVALAVGLFSVPIAVAYLGAERYGAWATIGSILAWAALADFGVGNHLTNALSAARGRDDVGAARTAVSTAFLVLCGLAGVGIAATIVAWRWVEWARVLNVQSATAISQAGPAVALSLVGLWLGLPLLVADRTYVAYQEGGIANAWGACASIATLVALVVATRTTGGLVAVAGAAACAALVVRGASAGWLFAARHREIRPHVRDVTGREIGRFLGGSSQFFLIQAAALVLFNTDNIIIAQVLGAEAVTPYAVAWRLFSVPNMALAAAFPYLWAGYAEALARGDAQWVLRMLKASTVAATAITTGLSLVLVVFGRDIIQLWAGAAAVPSLAVLLWMGAWNLLLAPANAAMCLLNATGQIRWQVWVGIVTAATNIAVSVWWARAFGISGVIAATVVTYLVCAGAPVAVVAMRTVRGLRAATKAPENVATLR